MAVHDHGTEEGPGLSCNELRLPSGELRGACIITDEELSAVRGTKLVRPRPTFSEPAEEVLYDFIASIPAVRIHASDAARARGRKVDLHHPATIIGAAVATNVFNRDNLLALVRAAMEEGATQHG